MKQTLPEKETEAVLSRLSAANKAFNTLYPGDTGMRQPVHTVYGGAQLFKADTTAKLGTLAVKAFTRSAPDFVAFARALQLLRWQDLRQTAAQYEKLLADEGENALRSQHPHVWLARAVYHRVADKLEKEPVEDYRIDFEDGYGNRPDTEEDAQAAAAAEELARGMSAGTLPLCIGIRIKPFTEELKHRGARTMDIFISTLLEKTGGRLPDPFIVTLPKVTIPEQVTAFCELIALLEKKNGIAAGTIKIEFMIEQAQTFINSKGECTLRSIVAASAGRCISMNLGTYDFTASCDVTAAYQGMDHPACDFARHMMKAAVAGTGIWLADGGTNIMPVESHRGDTLSAEQRRENEEVVHRAWKLAYDQISHSLRAGFYQGTDLHPGQLPVRYAACYAFFLEGLEAASVRLRAFTDKAAQATLVGDVFDDAATGQGLLNYFLRALNCGAITMDDVLATGLTIEEIRTRSFVQIVNGRRAKERVHV